MFGRYSRSCRKFFHRRYLQFRQAKEVCDFVLLVRLCKGCEGGVRRPKALKQEVGARLFGMNRQCEGLRTKLRIRDGRNSSHSCAPPLLKRGKERIPALLPFAKDRLKFWEVLNHLVDLTLLNNQC